MQSLTGEHLYRLVEAYSDLGDHRTGTAVDEATAVWLAAELERLGAEVSLEPFAFERFQASARLTIGDSSSRDSVEVPSAPVFYGAIGTHRTHRLGLVEVPAGRTGDADALDHFLDEAAAAGLGGLVVAIDGPDDAPVQANRWPVVRGSVPAVIVAGNWTERAAAAVDDGRAELSFDASTVASEGRNVLAHLGPAEAPPVIVTTPLTGWFRCAAERGTGIAAALALAATLAADHRVEFVGCGGHELHFRGLEHHLEQRSATGAVVVQLGASVGATVPTVDGPGVLDPARRVLTTAAGPLRATIADMVAPGNWSVADREHADGQDRAWPGESGVWQRAGAQVLAFLGHSHWFHTAMDVPHLATSPNAMATATSVAIDTARNYVAQTTHGRHEGEPMS